MSTTKVQSILHDMSLLQQLTRVDMTSRLGGGGPHAHFLGTKLDSPAAQVF